MPSPARRMGVNPTLCLTTEPVKGLIGDCCGLSEDGPNPRARLMISALTPWTFISSSPRLASYPSMMLSSWIPCGAVLRDTATRHTRWTLLRGIP